MILPAMGVMSEVITTFCRREIFGYRFIAMSSIAIAVIGFLVWGHHMFPNGQSGLAQHDLQRADDAGGRSPRPSKSGTGWPRCTKARSSLQTPMCYALAFFFLFAIGGLTGLFLGALAVELPRARHVFRRRPFSLRDGRRSDDHVPRRAALLVAEDHRPDVQRATAAGWRACCCSWAST